MRKFLIALTFFTRIKLNLKDVTEDEFHEAMYQLPFVGLVIGFLLCLGAEILKFINIPMLNGIFIIFLYLWITGGLHLDGLADSMDGMMSARKRERILEIMHDSTLGSFGAIALIMYFLSFFGILNVMLPLTTIPLLVMPVVGRFCALQACYFSDYAPGGGGLGKPSIENIKLHHILPSFILILILCSYLGIYVLVGFGVAILATFVLTHKFKKVIGGMTGDTLGMTIEVAQVVFLFALTIMLIHFPYLYKGVFL